MVKALVLVYYLLGYGMQCSLVHLRAVRSTGHTMLKEIMEV